MRDATCDWNRFESAMTRMNSTSTSTNDEELELAPLSHGGSSDGEDASGDDEESVGSLDCLLANSQHGHSDEPPSTRDDGSDDDTDDGSDVGLWNRRRGSSNASAHRRRHSDRRRRRYEERSPRTGRRMTWLSVVVLLFMVMILVGSAMFKPSGLLNGQSNTGSKHHGADDQSPLVEYNPDDPLMVPLELSGSVYDTQADFVNEADIRPPFWQSKSAAALPSASGSTSASTPTSALSEHEDATQPKYVKLSQLSVDDLQAWGPCYKPLKYKSRNSDQINWEYELNHTTPYQYGLKSWRSRQGVSGLCRPGFIILGAGKCGTSSLYHYLADHPRVLPAIKKQIHYFTYHLSQPLSWYFAHFPTTANFLANGALMTGEASPGYLPYPETVHQLAKVYRKHKKITTLGDEAGGISGTGEGGADDEQVEREQERGRIPRMITVGRDPLQRSYSSYRYNYVIPTIEKMREGKIPHVPKNLTNDEDYERYLLSFEDMVKAELQQLRKCLGYWTVGDDEHSDQNDIFVPGFGANMTKQHWHPKPWARNAIEKFDQLYQSDTTPTTSSVDPNLLHAELIDLDEVCYGKPYSRTIPRIQWEDLLTQYPEKVVLRTNAFLTSTLIGRSLYVLPLEWWYLEFDRSNLYFMCTEELSDITGEPLNEVSVNFLGLPRYDNFSAVVAKGAYNVGGHRGYDKATGWDTVNAEHEQDGDGTRKLSHKKQKHKKGETKVEEQQAADSTHENAINTGGVPLSAEVHQEFHDFVGPYNERLFALTGRRCNWEM